ncbi:ADP-ribosylhydrolase ARH3 [Myxocyprinus asiaticus]|uniref:ADP-ribosylhydrolase ARH3 n=1 Tax=Myxocyprinus asiaticus TaxID=70543 RepID=UPI0022233725|nr:ADP-ribosylhydrolase ARH3 [Myxocyprinus asiaticus]
MSAAARIAAPATLSRFRGALVGAVLGDCIGGEFEGAVDVPLDRVLLHLSALEDETRGDGILQFSDDTAMMRCVADSLLTRTEFDEQDMARRFAKEYNLAPGRGYGSGVIQVLRKLASPHLKDVFQPARAQFGGRGSFGNGGAMRAAPFALAFESPADVRRYSRLGAMLTHSCSLGYNGAVLQALAVHLSLQGALALPRDFINRLISEMEEVEKDETAQLDAKALNLSEFPYCTCLHRVKELMERNTVSIEEVISELGNGIAALQSVPTAIFCVLHCLKPRDGLPERFGGLERTIAYSLALGGDTDTIACMAGAIAGAHYGIESIPQSWQKCCEGVEEADVLARRLYDLYCFTQFDENRGTTSWKNNQPHTHACDQHTTKTD